MNVVQVKYLGNFVDKRYTYSVPDAIKLTKGDIVRVKNQNGKEATVECVSDSEDLSDNAIDMIMEGKKVCSSVIGKYSLVYFNKVFEF